jgi:hypothetical protein
MPVVQLSRYPLSASPDVLDATSTEGTAETRRRHRFDDLFPVNAQAEYAATGNRVVQASSDRLGLRKLGHS